MLIATRVWLAAILVLIALATMAGLVLSTIGAVDRAVSARRDARELLLQIDLALSELRDAESSQRGYLLTGIDSDLAPFQSGIRAIPERLNELKQATTGVAEQLRRRVACLEELSKEKIGELQQTVAVRRDQGFEAARKLVMTGRGKQLMDQASQVVSEIKALQRATIDQRTVELKEIHHRSIVGLVVGTLCVAACILLTDGLIARSLGRRFEGLQWGIGRIAGGDLTQDVEVSGNDELSQLACAFNSMVGDLRAERVSRQQTEEEVARGAVALKAHSLELEQRAGRPDVETIENDAKSGRRRLDAWFSVGTGRDNLWRARYRPCTWRWRVIRSGGCDESSLVELAVGSA